MGPHKKVWRKVLKWPKIPVNILSFWKRKDWVASKETHFYTNETLGSEISEPPELKLNANKLYVWGQLRMWPSTQPDPKHAMDAEVAQMVCCESQLGLDDIQNGKGKVWCEIPEPTYHKLAIFESVFILEPKTQTLPPLLDGTPSKNSTHDQCHYLPSR